MFSLTAAILCKRFNILKLEKVMYCIIYQMTVIRSGPATDSFKKHIYTPTMIIAQKKTGTKLANAVKR